jgi:hypothetical protein
MQLISGDGKGEDYDNLEKKIGCYSCQISPKQAIQTKQTNPPITTSSFVNHASNC